MAVFSLWGQMEKSTYIQVYLEAQSKDELIKKMIANNAKHGCYFKYSTPKKYDGVYETWYYIDIRKIMPRRKA